MIAPSPFRFQSALLATRNVVLGRARKRRLDGLAELGKTPCCVTFYHRIADTTPNDWTLSRSEFCRHLDHFEERFQFVDLAEVQKRVACGGSKTPTMTVTFDDGYRENAEFALPLLIERKIPCTYFVTTENILRQRPFAHDVAAGAPLPVNTPQEIREYSDAGIEMGCHTRTHVDFKDVQDPEEIRREILGAKDELEQITGKRCRFFAFPFGMPEQLTQAAIEAVHEAGFDGFCSAFGAYNEIGRDWFHIRRFHGDPEFQRVKNWTSFDASKKKKEPVIRYHLPPATSFEETMKVMNLPGLGDTSCS